jgi:hypothetical protein
MKPYYYYTKKKVDVKEALTSVKKFNKAKNDFEKEIKDRKEKILEMKNADEIIHESFISAVLNYEEKEKSNFNFLFSSEVAKVSLREKRKKEVKIEPVEKINVEQKLDLEKVKEFIIGKLRELKPSAKLFFSLRYSIKFEKPIDEYEEKINMFSEKNLTYDEIKTLNQILFNKKRTRQAVEQSVRYTSIKIKDSIEKNEEIKKVLEEIFN